MIAKVVKPIKKFEPVTIQITFESEREIAGVDAVSFCDRFDLSKKGGSSSMTFDLVCVKIREALKTTGY